MRPLWETLNLNDPLLPGAVRALILGGRGHFAGQSGRLVQLLQGACADPATFDAEAAGADLEALASMVICADLYRKAQRAVRPRRPGPTELLRLQLEWQKLWPPPNREGAAWDQIGKVQGERIRQALTKATRRKPGRPADPEKRDAIIARFLATIYQRHTGKTVVGPRTLWGGGARYHSPFSELLQVFLYATNGKNVGVERVRQIIRQAREPARRDRLATKTS